MTPQSSLGMGNANLGTTSPSSSNLYNSISSRGLSGETDSQESQEPTEETNPAEVAIQRFGQAFEPLKTLMSTPQYAVAEKEAQEVNNAVKNWLQAVVSAISPVGGESRY